MVEKIVLVVMSFFLQWGDANLDHVWDLDDLNRDGIIDQVDAEWLAGLKAANLPTCSKTVADLQSHLNKFASVKMVIIPDTMKDPYAIRSRIAQESHDATGIILLGDFPSFKLQIEISPNNVYGSIDNLYGDFGGQFGHVNGVHRYYAPDVMAGQITDKNKFPRTYVQPRWVTRINPLNEKGDHFYAKLLWFLDRAYNYQWHDNRFSYLLDTTLMPWTLSERYGRLFTGFQSLQQKLRGTSGYDYDGNGVVYMHPDYTSVFWEEIKKLPKILVLAGHGEYYTQGNLGINSFYQKVPGGAELIKLDGCATARTWAYQSWPVVGIQPVENIAQYIVMNTDSKIVVANGVETAGGFWFDGPPPSWFDDLLANNGHVGRVVQNRINRKTGDWTQIYELTVTQYGWPALKWPGGYFFIE